MGGDSVGPRMDARAPEPMSGRDTGIMSARSLAAKASAPTITTEIAFRLTTDPFPPRTPFFKSPIDRK